MSLQRFKAGAHPGRLWGAQPPGVTKGAPKRKEKNRERREKKDGKKGKNKKGRVTTKRKDTEVNQHDERGVIQVRMAPPFFFVKIRHMSLCGRL